MRKSPISLILFTVLLSVGQLMPNPVSAKNSTKKMCTKAEAKYEAQVQLLYDYNEETLEKIELVKNARGQTHRSVYLSLLTLQEQRTKGYNELEKKVNKKLVKVNKDLRKYCK